METQDIAKELVKHRLKDAEQFFGDLIMESAEVVLATFARDLERQLEASKAEIELLKLQRDRALEIASDYHSEAYLIAEMENPILQYPPTTPPTNPTP